MKKFVRLSAVLVAFIILISSVGTTLALNEGIDYSYSVNENFERATLPETFKVSSIISGSFDGKEMAMPEDMFIAKDGFVYIADTGNDRILKLTTDGEFVLSYKAEDAGGLNGPKGVYVTPKGEIYIADTGNKRLLALNADGTLRKEFPKPKSELLSDTMIYEPTKIMVNNSELIYVVMGKEFMSITQKNEFFGYLGSDNVGFSLKNMFINMFASETQKALITKVQPSAYNNFDLGSDGIVYAVANSRKDQIKKITSVGENIYEEKFFGEYVYDKNNVMIVPYYNDIAVDDSGLIYVCETNSKTIYQYDQKGNSISTFGGSGDTRGYFSMPVALDIDAKGRVFVLDSERGNIQIFEQTYFMEQVSLALTYFENGRYDDANSVLNQIVELNSSYAFAHDVLGTIELKKKNYSKAMEHFEISGNQEDYGTAYGKLLHDKITDNFGIVAIAVIVAVFAIAIGLGKFKKIADKWNRELFHID